MRQNPTHSHSAVIKIRRALLLIIILIVHKSVAQQHSGSPLEKKITLQAVNEPILHVLQKIEKQAHVNFSYNSSVIDSTKRITIYFKDKSIEDALLSIFSNRIKYKVIGSYIILVRNDETSINSPNKIPANGNAFHEKQNTVKPAITNKARNTPADTTARNKINSDVHHTRPDTLLQSTKNTTHDSAALKKTATPSHADTGTVASTNVDTVTTISKNDTSANKKDTVITGNDTILQKQKNDSLLNNKDTVSFSRCEFGILLGINFSDVIGLNTEHYAIGGNIGISSNIHIGNKLSIQPELLYSVKGYRFPIVENNTQTTVTKNLSYIQIPVQLKAFGVFIGPYIGFLLFSSDTYGNTINSSPMVIDFTGANPISTSKTTTKITTHSANGNYRNIDIGGTVGMLYQSKKRFSLGITYSQGFTSISSVSGGNNIVNSVLSIYAGYRIH